MGAILARFRKKPSTMEVLESLDKDIQALFKFKRRNQQLEKHYIGMLLLYSIILYAIGTVVVYFYYFPNNWKGRLLCALPLLVFPFIIWGVKKMLHWYFVKRTTKNDLALEELLEKKKKMLEDVMEHETYKTAKEILEKYDPTFKKPESPPVRPQMAQGRSPPGSAVRQRTPAARGMVGAPPGQGTPGQQMRLQRPITTPRPILPRDRGAVDKVVEYLVGDGPNYRYALICKICQSHNGMALAEEFEYLAFKCAYCNGMNPARKTKPNAPPLAVALHGGTPPPTPKRQHQGTIRQPINQQLHTASHPAMKTEPGKPDLTVKSPPQETLTPKQPDVTEPVDDDEELEEGENGVESGDTADGEADSDDIACKVENAADNIQSTNGVSNGIEETAAAENY